MRSAEFRIPNSAFTNRRIAVKTALSLVVMLFSASSANAQLVFRTGPGGGGPGGGTDMLDKAPGAYGVASWKAGEWARYSIQATMGPQMQMQSFRTVSVVGQDGDRFWVEVSDETVSPMSMRAP